MKLGVFEMMFLINRLNQHFTDATSTFDPPCEAYAHLTKLTY